MNIRQYDRDEPTDVFDNENVEFVTLEEAGLEESHNQPCFDINTAHEFIEFMYDGLVEV